MTDTIVTRFAPSPTGMLHVGGARTALFNWLFARANGGQFKLRIEDTDRVRSTPEATEAIKSGLDWLGLDWDGGIVSQFERRELHAAAAWKLLEMGGAYKCFSTPAEIEAARRLAKEQNRTVLFQSPWRDADQSEHPDLPYTVRLKSPLRGTTQVEDAVAGTVSWNNETLDDMIILRSDGTPTYNLAVVVDDHDMGVSHVIRGDDHLSNSARQKLIYEALGWEVPVFAHVPLILNEDGRKLSKRQGDPGLDRYKDLGILPEAMCNYLTRLGWSHGNEEFFTREQAVSWFALEALNSSPARLNQKRLMNLSRQHLQAASCERLIDEVIRLKGGDAASRRSSLLNAMQAIKPGARTLHDLAARSEFLFADRPVALSSDAVKHLAADGKTIVSDLLERLQCIEWNRSEIESAVAELCGVRGLKLGRIAQPVRAALSGSTISPSIFDMLCILGRDESLGRLSDSLSTLD